VGVPDQHHFGRGVHLILRDAVCDDRFRIYYPAFHSGELITALLTLFSFFDAGIPQMIGGFIHPGKPMANMYFVLFGYSKQGSLLRFLALLMKLQIP